MNPEEQALLEQLNDIAAPAQPGWWPPAIGWWVLAILLIALLIYLLTMTKKRKQHQLAQAWRELALAEHQRIRSSALSGSGKDGNPALSDLSVLMRRVALAVLPRAQIAAVTDQQWLAALDSIGQTSEYTDGVGQLLHRAPYRKKQTIAEEDLSRLLDLTEATISRADNIDTSQEEPVVAAL